jgi:predicted Zn finger-like uncharacterized protein
MNIACTACSARYGVADEKLIGKRVRITCKRCGTVLIVDGNTDPPTVSASTSMAPSPPVSVRPPSVKAPAPEPPFMVAFADGRQEQADIAQIVRFHRAGQLGTDSVVWRDGMADWADPWDVEDIAAAFRRMGYARPTPAPAPERRLHDAVDDETTRVVESSPQHEAPLFDDNEATNVVDSSRLGSPGPLPDPRVASRPVSEDDEAPTHVGRGLSTHATAAAREAQRARRASSSPPRDAGRNQPARTTREPQPRQQQRASARPRTNRPSERPQEDMFARQATAGSEAEQAAQAELGPGYELDIPKLTGARNESSVLFSLDSLLKQEQKPTRAARPPRRDESMLVDSGASLPVGGGIAPALSAPDFTAPVSIPPPQPTTVTSRIADDDAARSSRAWLYVVVLVAFGGAGALGWTTGTLPKLLVKAGVLPAPAATESAARPAAPPSATASPDERALAMASAEAAASAAAAASASAAPSAAPATATGAATPRATAPATGASPTPRPTTTATEGSTAATPKPTSTAAPTAEGRESPSPTPTAAGASAPFDTAAAKEALSTAAANVASCKEMGGPVGNGRVSITFAPSGRPTSVAVTGDLAGTTVGSCIARLFRTVRVPSFSGDAVTVAKGFAVQ